MACIVYVSKWEDKEDGFGNEVDKLLHRAQSCGARLCSGNKGIMHHTESYDPVGIERQECQYVKECKSCFA